MPKSLKVTIKERWELDNADWDAYMACSYYASVFTQSWYLDAVSPGWRHLEVYTAEGSPILKWPIYHQQKLGLSLSRQPLLCRYGGPIPAPDGVMFSEDWTRALHAAAGALKWRYPILEHYGHPDVDLPSQMIHTLRKTTRVRLLAAEDPLLSTGNTWKRYYKKALSQGMKFRQTGSIEELISILEDNAANGKEILAAAHFPLAERVARAAGSQGAVDFFSVYSGSKLLAMNMILRERRFARQLFTNTLNGPESSAAGRLLMTETLRHYAQKSMCFDFLGSEIPGVAKYYLQAGGRPFSYPVIQNGSKIVLSIMNAIRK